MSKIPETEFYSLTVKRLLSDAQKEDYDLYIKHLSEYPQVTVVRTIFERNKKGTGYHLHGVLQIEKGFYRRSLCLQKFHVKMDLLVTKSDYKNWLRYINKDVKPTKTIKLFGKV